MTIKNTSLAWAFFLVLVTTLPLRAQTGCEDSPEDPTIVLGLVAGALTYGAMVRAVRGRKQ